MWEAEVGMGWIEFAGYCPLAGEQMAGDWDVAVVIVEKRSKEPKRKKKRQIHIVR